MEITLWDLSNLFSSIYYDIRTCIIRNSAMFKVTIYNVFGPIDTWFDIRHVHRYNNYDLTMWISIIIKIIELLYKKVWK